MEDREKPNKLEQGDWYFISFVDRVKNIQLGACNICVPEDKDPLDYAHEKGINPGGEAAVYPLKGPEPGMEFSCTPSPETSGFTNWSLRSFRPGAVVSAGSEG